MGIICWRKFSGKDENENENAINLEFLLDPNAPTMDPNATMHINDNHNYHTLKTDLFDDDDLNNNNDENDNGNDADDDDENNDNNIKNDDDDEYEEVTDEDIENDNPLIETDYNPPNFNRI